MTLKSVFIGATLALESNKAAQRFTQSIQDLQPNSMGGICDWVHDRIGARFVFFSFSNLCARSQRLPEYDEYGLG
jgi:hypothetical protein